MGDGVTPGMLGPSSQQPKKPMTEEEMNQSVAEAKYKADMQEQQLREANAKNSKLQQKIDEGPKLQYNPIETITGPDGKKTIQLRKELQMAGPEAYVQSERERLRSQQALGLDDLQKQIAQQQAQQQGRLAQYGMKGGNRALMGRYSMRDALMAQQGLGRQFQTQAGELEARGMQLGRETQAANIAALGKGIQGVEQFELEKWKKAKEVEASKYQAEASRPQDTGGCCFIFLEARYGNGVMDSVVRAYRDEELTPRRQRGYYKLSQVLIPLMRKYPIIKFIVRVTMTDPLVMYGKAHYRKGSKLGFIFKPLKDFWLKTFDYLGQDHKFIRANGEEV